MRALRHKHFEFAPFLRVGVSVKSSLFNTYHHDPEEIVGEWATRSNSREIAPRIGAVPLVRRGLNLAVKPEKKFRLEIWKHQICGGAIVR